MSNIKKFRIKSFKGKKSILELEKISLKFGKKIILDNLNLKSNNGQILGLLGPNGVENPQFLILSQDYFLQIMDQYLLIQNWLIIFNLPENFKIQKLDLYHNMEDIS